MRPLTLQQAEYVAHRLAKELMNFDEPLPDFSTRYPGKLESCLGQPFQTFDGQELYPSLVDKAAVLFYLIIKNHPFENGNKRMAVTMTLVFLFINGHWVGIDPDSFYRLAIEVANSNAQHKEKILEILKNVFTEFLTS